MEILRPGSPGELADALRAAAAGGQKIRLGGAFSKNGMAGPVAAADVCITTASLNQVLQYDPRDLTISVGSGMLWSELTRTLAAHRQMIPLDPPFADTATVGGVVAANTSGPRRRLYGSVRDAVIGVKFATLEGKLVQSGGMVVKNVAGLDMGKLMIGSFGTLAAIAVVNFKLTPMPHASRTFIFRFGSAADVIAARDRVLAGVLQPAAMDVLNPAASARAGLSGFVLLIQAVGVPAVLARYAAESGAEALGETGEAALWTAVREFTPDFLRQFPGGMVRRVSTTLTGLGALLENETNPVVARAANGVAWVYSESASPNGTAGFRSAIEFAPEAEKPRLDLWPDPGSDFDVMKRIKAMFDPQGILNRGRLYGRI
jgi:glycolate oxidase FAD binding subunit